jgi:hypothetical protein
MQSLKEIRKRKKNFQKNSPEKKYSYIKKENWKQKEAAQRFVESVFILNVCLCLFSLVFLGAKPQLFRELWKASTKGQKSHLLRAGWLCSTKKRTDGWFEAKPKTFDRFFFALEKKEAKKQEKTDLASKKRMLFQQKTKKFLKISFQ